MSKKVKSLIERDLKVKVGEVDTVAVVSPMGVDGNTNNGLRRRLHAKGVRMTVVKNTLAKRAVGSGKLSGFDSLLSGPSALVYGKAGASDIARMLVEAKKENEKLELRGIFFDGEVYQGDKGVEQVSKFPTRAEAIGQVLSALLGPGSSVLGALLGPGGTVASLVKAIEEKAEKAGSGDAAAAAPAETPAPTA